MHHPRQDSTYHGLCYTSRGALAGTRNIYLLMHWAHLLYAKCLRYTSCGALADFKLSTNLFAVTLFPYSKHWAFAIPVVENWLTLNCLQINLRFLLSFPIVNTWAFIIPVVENWLTLNCLQINLRFLLSFPIVNTWAFIIPVVEHWLTLNCLQIYLLLLSFPIVNTEPSLYQLWRTGWL